MSNELLLEWEEVTFTCAHRAVNDDRFDFFRFWWEAVTAELTRRGVKWSL